MGAGGACTDGVNLLPPVGSRFFSVGVVDELDVAGVDVVDGDSFSPPPQPDIRTANSTPVIPTAMRLPRRIDPINVPFRSECTLTAMQASPFLRFSLSFSQQHS